MITEAAFNRHYRHRGDRYGALLDIVQDYVLYFLHAEGYFERGVVFKGGTPLKKYRAEKVGRDSSDFDFEILDELLCDRIFEILSDASFLGVNTSMDRTSDNTGNIIVDTQLKGSQSKESLIIKVDMSTRGVFLPFEILPAKPNRVHRAYEFDMPSLPIMNLIEAIAEKLAAWYYRRGKKDFYDIYWFGLQGKFEDNDVLRALFVCKLWRDLVMERPGTRRNFNLDNFFDSDTIKNATEDIGIINQDTSVKEWGNYIETRFNYLLDFDKAEKKLLKRLNENDMSEVNNIIKGLPGWDSSMCTTIKHPHQVDEINPADANEYLYIVARQTQQIDPHNERCPRKTADNKPCKNYPMRGYDVCRAHKRL